MIKNGIKPGFWIMWKVLLFLLGVVKGWTTPLCTTVLRDPDLSICLPSGCNTKRKSPIVNLRQTKNDNEETQSCPFSMKFPRYKINLTSGSESENKEISPSPVSGLFSGLKNKVDKMTVEKKYLSGKGCNIRYINNLTSNFQEENDIVKKKAENGVYTSEAFWRALSDVSKIDSLNDIDEKLVLAIPEASFLTMKRLVNIANWLEDYATKSDGLLSNQNSINSIVHAQMDEEMPIPTAVFTVKKSNNYADELLCINRMNKNLNKSNVSTEKIVNERTKAWVKRVLVELGICPFTKSTTRSGQGLADVGVPVGKIAYHFSSADTNNIVELMADTWSAIGDMVRAGPGGKNGVSSILLAAHEFDDSFPLWAGPIFSMLESNVGAANAESLIGIVCFHPRYVTPDGSSWPGFGHLHSLPRLKKWVYQFNENKKETSECNYDENSPMDDHFLSDTEIAAGGAWQRRTPHATINILWAQQLEAAEGRRETGKLYAKNIQTLVCDVGLQKLENDLKVEKSIGES